MTLQTSIEFDAFSYAIAGANFSKSGSIDVSSSNTVSALIHGIPVGSGYTITLSGTSAAPKQATCSGSATFAISADAVTNVPVVVSCRLLAAPAPVPIPPVAVAALGLLLLGSGALFASRRSA
ncbi:MAG TPA: hypothetical protein VK524_00905 [Polyangiaceae bacterium]|nr:hypothetical protein [Polyangiaceae bacterium]